jgi:hypothetical protein
MGGKVRTIFQDTTAAISRMDRRASIPRVISGT